MRPRSRPSLHTCCSPFAFWLPVYSDPPILRSQQWHRKGSWKKWFPFLITAVVFAYLRSLFFLLVGFQCVGFCCVFGFVLLFFFNSQVLDILGFLFGFCLGFFMCCYLSILFIQLSLVRVCQWHCCCRPATQAKLAHMWQDWTVQTGYWVGLISPPVTDEEKMHWEAETEILFSFLHLGTCIYLFYKKQKSSFSSNIRSQAEFSSSCP